mmetsp:Transcript_55947/g.162162  ORF Transcript_55947/g.162162 Transcript_55947/m.162162 type:complete len:86 (+) Transcript_55947:1479-1736(+)
MDCIDIYRWRWAQCCQQCLPLIIHFYSKTDPNTTLGLPLHGMRGTTEIIVQIIREMILEMNGIDFDTTDWSMLQGASFVSKYGKI